MSKKPVTFEDLLTVKDRVEFLLKYNEVLRDSDMKLVSTYYFHVIGKEAIKRMTAYEVLNMLANNEFPPIGTISRARRRLQRKFVELRGKNYGKYTETPLFEFRVTFDDN